MTCGPNALSPWMLGAAVLIGCNGAVAMEPEPSDEGAPGALDGWSASQPPPDDAGVVASPLDPRAPVAPVDPGSAKETEAAEPSTPGSGEDTAAATPDLGALPPELSELAWPARPRTTREVTVTTAAELTAEAAVAGTRILARGVSGGDVTIAANDVEIVADEATSLGVLDIPHGTQRVRVEGGSWGGVNVAVPADFGAGGGSYSPELMSEDLWFEGMKIDAADTAFNLRGRRIAVVDNDVKAARYSVWVGDTADFQTEDLVLLENAFESAGPEATVRLVSVLRSAAVSNTLSNPAKHNYRIHGTSDLNFAADNLLIGSGVMLGRMDGDHLNRVWFDDNVFHHTTPDLFNPDAAIGALVARRNLAHTDVWNVFYGGPVQPGWELSENVIVPYEPPAGG